MSSSHSSRFGYVVLLALLVLWPVMILLRQRKQSLVYQPMSDATVPETDAICERLSAMKIGYGVRQMHIDKAFHGIYTTGGGLGTKMGIYVKKSDYEQARPIAEQIMNREG